MKCFKDVLIGVLNGKPDDKKIVETDVLILKLLLFIFILTQWMNEWIVFRETNNASALGAHYIIKSIPT